MLGPVAQESVVDSALLRSIFRPFKPAFLYTSCTQSPRGTRHITSELLVIRPESGQVGTGAAYRASYCETSGLLRFHPSGFDDTRRAFTLAQHEARKLRLRHAHWIGPVLRKQLAQIRRGQNARDVLR